MGVTMKTVKNMILLTALCTTIMTGLYGFAETGKDTCDPNEFFNACDKNRDGKISREEWNEIDSNKDDTVTQDEWNKYRYRTTDTISGAFQFKFYDIYSKDGYMDRDEFLRNIR
jgi:Ca2+-binding EF-hand superfamily protein